MTGNFAELALLAVQDRLVGGENLSQLVSVLVSLGIDGVGAQQRERVLPG